LTKKAFELGLASEERVKIVEDKLLGIKKVTKYLATTSVAPEEVRGLLLNKDTTELSQKSKLINVLLRPQISIKDLVNNVSSLRNFINDMAPKNIDEILEEAEIQIKYGGYIDKEKEIAAKLEKFEDLKLSPDMDYFSLQSLSYEAREKLSKIKPYTIGQAARISGVSPADISVLTVYLGR
jgi:tRNA uridine 5-carboxymethylaminomethyl modification enzyme